MSPSGTPYSPRETTPADVQPRAGSVPRTQSRTWSSAAWAADATDEEPRTSMISAPRLATRGTNTSSSHGSTASAPPSTSASASGTAIRAPGSVACRTVACVTSGNCVAEWLPQIVRSAMASGCDVERAGELPERTVVIEAGESGEAVGGNVGRGCRGDQRIGVGRVPHHDDADVVGGVRPDRGALRTEDAGVRTQQIGPLHAPVRGGAPRRRIAMFVPSKPRTGSSATSTDSKSGKAQSCSSSAAPSAARRPPGDLEQPQPHRAAGPSRSPAAMRNSSA